MLKDAPVFLTSATATYLWLCAIAAPLIGAVRSLSRERRRTALVALALACAAALLWTIVPLALAFIGMMFEPPLGLVVVRSHSLVPGLAAGICGWLFHFGVERRVPRFGHTFETATAIAIVAAVDDSAATLRRVESLYRGLATEGSRNVKTAPPSGLFEAWTSPPWRETMARTIDRPRPLPDGTRVPARDASTL